MISRLILPFLLFFCSITSSAQEIDWDNYSSFFSNGDIPTEFRATYTDKYDKLVEDINSTDKRYTRKNKEKEFYKFSEFYLNQFLNSGAVLYGDSISSYCQDIVDVLLKDDEELAQVIKVYTVKSDLFNAFCTANGILFVTTGLISEIENEAQLAFVLAHEIIHYRNDHVIGQYIEQEKISKSKDSYRKVSVSDQLKKFSNYSKDQELESDSIGFVDYFAKTGYDQREAYHLLDVMKYSYLPFEELPFEVGFLETDSVKIPIGMLPTEINAISAEDDYDDSESTHPNIKKRKVQIESLVARTDGQKFLFPESRFNYAQRLARYESCRLSLINKNFPEAIYSAFLLKKVYNDSIYHKQVVAKGLLNAAIYRNEGKYRAYTDIKRAEDVEGESHVVSYLLEEMEPEELSTLAAAYGFENFLEHSGRENEDIFKLSMENVFLKSDLTMSDFRFDDGSSSSEEIMENSEIDSTEVSVKGGWKAKSRDGKVSTINSKKEEKEQMGSSGVTERLYLKNAFWPYSSDSTFMETANYYQGQLDEKGKTKSTSDAATRESRYSEGTYCGVDSLLLINSIYINLKANSKDVVKFEKSDREREDYQGYINDLAGSLDLYVENLDYKAFERNETDKFNDLSVINDWVQERLDIVNTGGMCTDNDELRKIAEKYGVNYIAYTGNVSIKSPAVGAGAHLLLGALTLVYLPFAIAHVVTPDHSSFNFFFLLDARNSRLMLAEYNYYDTSDRNEYVKSIVYNNLLQVKLD